MSNEYRELRKSPTRGNGFSMYRSRPNRLTEGQQKIIWENFPNLDLRMQDVAQLAGCSTQSVRNYWLEQFGHQAVKERRGKYRSVPRPDLQIPEVKQLEIATYFDKPLSSEKIGEIVGVDHNTVCKYLKLMFGEEAYKERCVKMRKWGDFKRNHYHGATMRDVREKRRRARLAKLSSNGFGGEA